MINHHLQHDPMREQIYLAAMLQDIGKFYQRADTGALNSSKFLEEKTKNLDYNEGKHAPITTGN